jgi:hypothetical protein
MEHNKYHKIPKGAEILEIKNGRFTIKPVKGTKLSGPVSIKSRVTYKDGKFTFTKNPIETEKYHKIPQSAEILEIQNGRFTIKPVEGTNLTGPISNKSRVTYKDGRFTFTKKSQKRNTYGGKMKRKTKKHTKR